MRNNERAGGHHPALGRPSLVEPATTHAAMKKKQASESAALSVSERLAISATHAISAFPFHLEVCRRAKYVMQQQTKYPLRQRGAHHLRLHGDVGTCAIVFVARLSSRRSSTSARSDRLVCAKVVYSHLHSLLHQLCHCDGAKRHHELQLRMELRAVQRIRAELQQNYPWLVEARSVLALSSSYAQSSPS